MSASARDVPALDELPDLVRSRVVGLAAQVLPDVPRLPASLRKVATFAPARRARHGGSAIEAALEADDDFRSSVGVLVAGRRPSDGSPATSAARIWLVRGEAAAEELAAALEAMVGTPDADPQTQARLARLTDQVTGLQEAERDQRARHRAALQKLRDENAELRRKLGESRVAERAARERADRFEQERAASAAAAASTSSAAEAEVRRLRAQVEDLRAALSRGRAGARADRDEASMRARLLLDTVIDAASGLRRELALPPATGNPADLVEASVAGEGVRTPVTGLDPSSPALLDQLLALPRAHLVVDGYNVSKTGWPTAPLEVQRTRLLSALAALAARTRAEVTVVFDATAAGPRPVVSSPRGVRVVFSPEGVIADDVIRDYVAVEPPGRVVVVATSDRELTDDVVRNGAKVVTSAALIGALRR